MCRNIRTLFNFDPPATDAEIHAAALQFVRKISGYTKPSAANEAAFAAAVEPLKPSGAGACRHTSARCRAAWPMEARRTSSVAAWCTRHPARNPA